MNRQLIETLYPISFREDLAKALSQQLSSKHSVELIGIKRIGISNFLRFFINHENIDKTYIAGENPRLFIPVDLNDLIEREMFPFWRLTFKRIIDSLDKIDLTEKTKNNISNLFLTSIQTGDLLMTIDGVRDSLIMISKEGFIPVIFLIRFDRLKNVISPEFFNNLESLIHSTGHNLSFVFTTHRRLEEITPHSIVTNYHSAFSHPVYIQPANYEDMEIIFETLEEKYKLNLSSEIKTNIIKNSGGHVQYLLLSFIILNEQDNKGMTSKQIIKEISEDERIKLQSEELYDHLTKSEKTILMKIIDKKIITDQDRRYTPYLWNSGMINDSDKIFSFYFKNYLKKVISKHKKNSSSHELTKKENLLFTLLQENIYQICERDKIVEVVWPECKLYGVSDWSVDRLVSRLRKKLAIQNSDFEIETIRTRGFKLIKDNSPFILNS